MKGRPPEQRDKAKEKIKALLQGTAEMSVSELVKKVEAESGINSRTVRRALDDLIREGEVIEINGKVKLKKIYEKEEILDFHMNNLTSNQKALREVAVEFFIKYWENLDTRTKKEVTSRIKEILNKTRNGYHKRYLLRFLVIKKLISKNEIEKFFKERLDNSLLYYICTNITSEEKWLRKFLIEDLKAESEKTLGMRSGYRYQFFREKADKEGIEKVLKELKNLLEKAEREKDSLLEKAVVSVIKHLTT
jgi:hypothetical protein